MAQLMRTSNPALSDKAFQGPEIRYGGGYSQITERMTLNGTVNKTGILLVLAILTAGWTWHLFGVERDIAAVTPWMDAQCTIDNSQFCTIASAGPAVEIPPSDPEGRSVRDDYEGRDDPGNATGRRRKFPPASQRIDVFTTTLIFDADHARCAAAR